MTRVIHTGDTHLGYRQYHSSTRRRDFLAAFRQVIADAIEDDVDAVVHGGDLFHDRTPGLDDVHGAIDVLRDLRAADIPFLAVVGNHEQTRDRQWLDLFETIGLATRLDETPTRIGDTAFYGLDFVPRSRREELTYEFDPHEATHSALVAHGLFEPFPHADWDTSTVLESADVEFDAMLLADNHAPDRAEVDGTWVTYCGSTERTDASERDARGYNVVEFGTEVSIRRRGLDTRPFVLLDLELAEGEGEPYVRERVREENVENAVVIVTIDGEGEDIAAAEVEQYATDRGALVARVNDRREFDAESDASVRFADPDDAVADRLRELAPSVAARGVDETIRADDVPDTNVRARVTEHVESLLESDPTAFETVADIDAPDATDGGTEPGDPADSGESGSDPSGDDRSDERDEHATQTERNEDATDTEETATDRAETSEQSEDGQVTMGDYV